MSQGHHRMRRKWLIYGLWSFTLVAVCRCRREPDQCLYGVLWRPSLGVTFLIIMKIITVLLCKYTDNWYVYLSNCLYLRLSEPLRASIRRKVQFHFFFLQGVLANRATSQTSGELSIMKRDLCAVLSTWLHSIIYDYNVCLCFNKCYRYFSCEDSGPTENYKREQ